MNFASDNWAGAAPPIMDAIRDEAARVGPAYGSDQLTKRVTAQFAELFEREVAVFFVATGTAANSLALSALARPGGLVFCHKDAHVNTDEGGAAEFLAGVKLIGLDGEGGKITPAALSSAVDRYPANATRYGQPIALSLSELTEYGTAYGPDEIAALSDISHYGGLAVHMDGARFGNAVAGLGVSPAALTWKAGVDVLSFGGTKGGCWQAEAVVFFDPARATEMPYLRKRSGHLISKSRFIAAQFAAFLKDNLWLDLAANANAMAARLAEGLTAAGGRTAWPTDGNEVFAVLPREALARGKDIGAAFYEWFPDWMPADATLADDEALVRLVASFATRKEDVDRFVADVVGG
jgi:threonine aldolase